MKLSVPRMCVISLLVWLGAGCGKKSATTPVVKRLNTNSTQVVRNPAPPPKPPPTPKPPKQPKEAQPGTLAYLDAKNGFRDAIFGQPESALGSLVLKSQDDARQLKTYTRNGDTLMLENVPLDGIEYTFFQDRLCQVLLKWKMPYESGGTNTPPASEFTLLCRGLYGPPNSRQVSGHDRAEIAWEGHKARIVITEARLPGVADAVNGGWAMAPAVQGQMVFESLPLYEAAAATYASRKNGL